MTVVYALTVALLSVAALLTLIRMLRGPSVLDRVLALDVVAILLVSGIAVNGAVRGSNEGLVLLVTVALLAFVGTITAARLVEGDQR